MMFFVDSLKKHEYTEGAEKISGVPPPIVFGQFPKFHQIPDLMHFVSTRRGGVSSGTFESLNLSVSVQDKENGHKNRRILASALGIQNEKVLFPVQCHSDQIKIVDLHTENEDLIGTDALITATPGICIVVIVADCVPILLYDRKNHVAGTVHAGWRGTVSRITAKTIDKMKQHFNTKPSDIIAAIGPSISVDHYEVEEEVMKKAAGAFGKNSGCIRSSKRPGKWYFNLWEATRIQLLDSGVYPENIDLAGICTYDRTDIFFSARKLGPDSGRFGAGLMLVGR